MLYFSVFTALVIHAVLILAIARDFEVSGENP